jgi:hypothetical protein
MPLPLSVRLTMLLRAFHLICSPNMLNSKIFNILNSSFVISALKVCSPFYNRLSLNLVKFLPKSVYCSAYRRFAFSCTMRNQQQC